MRKKEKNLGKAYYMGTRSIRIRSSDVRRALGLSGVRRKPKAATAARGARVEVPLGSDLVLRCPVAEHVSTP